MRIYEAVWPTRYCSEHRTEAAAIRAAKAINKRDNADIETDHNYCFVVAVERDGSYNSRQVVWPVQSAIYIY